MPSYASTLALSLAAFAVMTKGTDAAACGKSINMKVLKPGYRLGAVVNYPADEVLDGSFWTEKRIADNMETIDVNSVKTTIQSVTSLVDKMNLLDISGALAIDLITSGISGSGSGGFLTSKDQSTTTASVVYHTQRKTKTDFVKEELMSELMAFNRFFPVPEATHVVTRVTYGGSVLLQFSEDSDSIESRDNLNAQLTFNIEKLKLKVDVEAAIILTKEEETEFQNVTLTVQSDLPLTTTPLTIDDVNAALAGIPEAFQRANDGRGIPLEVTLTPKCVWSSDVIGQKVRQITLDAVDEITDVMQAIFSGVASAKEVAKNAGKAGMPVLKVQAEDFANTLDRFASSVRVRLAQLLPSIRNSLASQTEAILFTSKMRMSPFNYLALRRWMETANEDILEQTRLRQNLLVEASFPKAAGKKKGEWINRKVYMINSFPQLQRLLVNPDIETAMVLITVNRNSGLSSHLDVMRDYMANPPLTITEQLQFPGNFDKAKWLEAPDNAFRTRGMTVNMARWAAQTECVLSGCINVKDGEALAMMDYNSFIEEFLSMGIKLDRTTVLLYRNGRLVNTDFQLCASPDDPRDEDGRCLWRGDADIPNGFSCALERPQGGCEGICYLDGRCRNRECSAILEVPVTIEADSSAVNDWHKIRVHPDAVNNIAEDVQETRGLFQDELPYQDKCLAFTPDTSRGVKIETCLPNVATQRWRWGSGLEKAHIKSERETTLCFEAVLEVFDDDGLGENGNGANAAGTNAPTQNGETYPPSKSPTKFPTSAPTDLQDIAEIEYGHIEMRQCSPFNPMQFFQRYTVDFDTPRLMLRPPVVQPYDYKDLCVKFVNNDGVTGLKLEVCAGNSIHQAVYETSAWRYFAAFGADSETSSSGEGMEVPRFAIVPIQFETTVAFVKQFDDIALNHFFWEGSYLRPWFTKIAISNLDLSLGYKAADNLFFTSFSNSIEVITDKNIKSPSPFFKVETQFHTFSEGTTKVVQVPAWDPSTNTFLDTNEYWTVSTLDINEQRDETLYGEEDALINGDLLQCPSLCEPLTCSDMGKKNAECFTASNKARCACRAGWGGDNCDVQVDACIAHECEIDEFCTDLLPPAGNSTNDRTCTLITLCKVNEFLARSNSTVTDAACSPCPESTIQPMFGIREVGVDYCKSVVDTTLDIITDQFPDADLPTIADGETEVNVKLQTEAELRKLCEARNSFYFPAQGDKVGPKCSEACPEDKYSDCSDLGCSCTFRVQPAPVVSETEFALIMGGSAALGLVAAVAVVIVVDAVLKKIGRA